MLKANESSPRHYLNYLLLILLLTALGCTKDSADQAQADAGFESDQSLQEDSGLVPELDQGIEEDGSQTPLEVSASEISIDTNNSEIPNEPKVNASLTITTDGQVVHTGKIGIEIRGSSSQNFPKKSYGVETWDVAGEDTDVSLLGMPEEEEDWILHGPYSDKSLIRNRLIYDLARDMDRYASRTQFAELTINGEEKGVYVFMEKLKRDKNRIDIDRLTINENSGENITGGYIIKIDKNNNGGFTNQNSFTSEYTTSLDGTGKTIKFLYDYPKPEDITSEQKEYIAGYINDFESALASNNFTDPQTGYAAYVDVDSFIDFFILNELSNNVDGYRISMYMHKDKNEKLKMGPIWDFNLAFGNADYCNGGDTDIWAYTFNDRCISHGVVIPFWWNRLMEDPAFTSKLQVRWAKLREETLSNSTIFQKIDTYIAILKTTNAVNSNFDAWPILGMYVWPNNFIGDTHAEEITYLKEWISARTKWLDETIAAL